MGRLTSATICMSIINFHGVEILCEARADTIGEASGRDVAHIDSVEALSLIRGWSLVESEVEDGRVNLAVAELGGCGCGCADEEGHDEGSGEGGKRYHFGSGIWCLNWNWIE